METQDRMCGLCSKTCANFPAIEGDMEYILDVVLPKRNLAVIQKLAMCTNCTKMLMECFDFKVACFYTRDYLISFLNNERDVKLDLKALRHIENGTGVPEDQDICGFCMDPVKKCSAISLDVEEGDTLKKMVERCLPELDINIINKPVICAPCRRSLEECCHFVSNYLIVEEKIKKDCETLNINSNDQLEVSSLLQSKTRDGAVSEADGKLVYAIKVEKQYCEQRENANERKTCSESDEFKLEPMICKEVNLAKIEDQKFLSNEEIEIKAEEQDCRSVQDSGISPQEDTHNYNLRERQKCSVVQPSENLSQVSLVKSSRKYTNEAGRRALPQRRTSENVYQCASCLFRTKYKRNMNTHNLIHKNPTQIRMLQCKLCSFKTKYKGSLKTHMLLHRKPLERTMYRCDFCSYQVTQNKCLMRHMLTHSNPTEVKLYKCASCLFHTKYKESLYAHMRIHRDSSEVTIHRCDVCSFNTKYKKHMKRHLLTHKDPSEVTMHHCDMCSYSTKRNYYLKQHLLIHKARDNNEITMYRCASCSFQTKSKSSLVQHFSIHKNPSERTVYYPCDLCSYQTRQKSNLKSHLLIHKEPSEGEMYHCASCSFQTKRKRSLEQHLSIHKNPSETTMYPCDLCSYQARRKSTLKSHLLIHKEPSEIKMYRCASCLFQTKNKYYLIRHFLIHKNPAKITIGS